MSETKPASREETRAQTRSAILRSAERLFLAKGYQGTSLEEIAEDAGYSKGAVYSNFESKEALYVQVNAARDERKVQPLLDALGAGGDLEAKLGALEGWLKSSSERDHEWVLVETEFALVAHRTSDMAERLAVLHRESRESIAELLVTQATAAGITLPLDPDVIAESVIALLRGFALAHALDPAVRHSAIVPVFRQLIGVEPS